MQDVERRFLKIYLFFMVFKGNPFAFKCGNTTMLRLNKISDGNFKFHPYIYFFFLPFQIWLQFISKILVIYKVIFYKKYYWWSTNSPVEVNASRWSQTLSYGNCETTPSKWSPMWCLSQRFRCQSQYEKTFCRRINNITMSIFGSVYVPHVGVGGGGVIYIHSRSL